MGVDSCESPTVRVEFRNFTNELVVDPLGKSTVSITPASVHHMHMRVGKTAAHHAKALEFEENLRYKNDVSSGATIPMESMQEQKILPIKMSDMPNVRREAVIYSRDIELPEPPRPPLASVSSTSTGCRQTVQCFHRKFTYCEMDENVPPNNKGNRSESSPIDISTLIPSAMDRLNVDVNEKSVDECHSNVKSSGSPSRESDNQIPCISSHPVFHEPQYIDDQAFKRQVLYMLHNLDRRLQNIEARLVAQSNQRFCPVSVSLPINTLHEFDLLSAEVSIPKIAKKMIKYLRVSSGPSVGDIIRNIVRRLFTSNLCAQLTWNGVHERAALSKSPLKSIIIDAVPGHMYPGFTHEGAVRKLKRTIIKSR